jgi:hypothetical protein
MMTRNLLPVLACLAIGACALKDGSIKTYPNGCGACADINVTSWVENACPE